MAVSDLYAAFKAVRFIDIRYAQEIKIIAHNFLTIQSLVFCKNHFIGFGSYLLYKDGISHCYSKALSLSHGVMDDALVSAENLSVLIHEIALGRNRCLCISLYISGIVAVNNKTYLLGITLLRHGKACLCGNVTNLRLCVGSEGH